jgi:ADP-ribose pyrophosphatase YjhB (NUDIX family)
MDGISPSLILLTYKGKVLLMHKQKNAIDQESHPWCFIGGFRQDKESFEQALSRRVEKETGIKIENVEFVSEFCYHANLTDDNVNKMQRAENQLLDFFTLKELNKLFLANSTESFISKHSSLI